MTTLLTGGTGHTSTSTARLLRDTNTPHIITYHSRPPADTASPSVRFSWTDESTWPGLFESAPNIRTVYLCAFNGVPDYIAVALKFVDFCIGKGAKRFVLLLGSSAEIGGPNGGEIWQGLVDRGVEYAIIMPTWFMENFLQGGIVPHHKTIVEEDTFYSSCGEGRNAQVSIDDIGAVVFHALTDEKPHNCAHTLMGPESLTHDEMAETMSEVLGRKIKHVHLPSEERIAQLIGWGLPAEYAGFLVSLEGRTKAGTEDKVNDVVQKVVSREGKTWRDFVEEHRGVWAKHVEG